MKNVFKIIETIEKASVQNRRSVGSSPDDAHFKRLAWTALHADTRIELTRAKLDQPRPMKADGRDSGSKCAVRCRAVTNGCNLYYVGQVVLGRETADVAMGISDIALAAETAEPSSEKLAEY